MHDAGFEVRHEENLREHYAKTLAAWCANLDAHWHEAVKEVGQGTARVWRLYMAGSRLGFDRNHIELHQVLGVRLAADGTFGMPLRPDWEQPRVLTNGRFPTAPLPASMRSARTGARGARGPALRGRIRAGSSRLAPRHGQLASGTAGWSVRTAEVAEPGIGDQERRPMLRAGDGLRTAGDRRYGVAARCASGPTAGTPATAAAAMGRVRHRDHDQASYLSRLASCLGARTVHGRPAGPAVRDCRHRRVS